MFRIFSSGLKGVRRALTKTRSALGGRINALFTKPLSDETVEELEKILYEADLGSTLAIEFTERINGFAKRKPDYSSDDLIEEMKKYALEILAKPPSVSPAEEAGVSPFVILLVGVNGSGKTTSVAKLGRRYQEKGKKVLLAAGDTFRAAATEQLTAWAERLKIECVKGALEGDPSSVIYDALAAGKARGIDIIIADTAGRLQSKTDLMKELAKIDRVCKKIIPEAPHEVFLVLDATTGQNGIDQAKTFNHFTPLTGLIITKLDGSAKGGIILSIYQQMGIPIRYIGIGEKINDFVPFDPESYVNALFES
jgi:fused signal recognition particle receptor